MVQLNIRVYCHVTAVQTKKYVKTKIHKLKKKSEGEVSAILQNIIRSRSHVLQQSIYRGKKVRATVCLIIKISQIAFFKLTKTISL